MSDDLAFALTFFGLISYVVCGSITCTRVHKIGFGNQIEPEHMPAFAFWPFYVLRACLMPAVRPVWCVCRKPLDGWMNIAKYALNIKPPVPRDIIKELQVLAAAARAKGSISDEDANAMRNLLITIGYHGTAEWHFGKNLVARCTNAEHNACSALEAMLTGKKECLDTDEIRSRTRIQEINPGYYVKHFAGV